MSKLLNLIFERLEYERLIEEGKDPVELLHYKFQNVPSEVIDAIISVDPTKKKSYSQWLLSHWDDEKYIILEALKNGRIKKLFQHFKQHNDVQIKDFSSVEDVLRSFVPEEDTVLSKSSQPMTYIENLDREVDSDLANDFDIVFDEDDWIIAVPNTYEAECKLGENMRWCTANHFGNGESYYRDYLSRGGKYYVNFDMSKPESAKGKDYPFTRYQFHFESRQFMDKDDDPINLDSIGIPDSAIEFYESEGYDTSDFENEEARMERYDQDRYSVSFRINNELFLSIEYNDNYEFEEPDAHTDFYLFDENDNRDPISWDEIPNPHINEDVVMLNDEQNGYVMLKKQFGDENTVVLAMRDSSQSRWREWSAYTVLQCLTLPHSEGFFGIDDKKHFTFYTMDGPYTYDGLKVENCEKIFVNDQCTDADDWERIFVETESDGYHSLFALTLNDDVNGYDIECIVKRDDPVNGEFFIVNEDGLVEGQFRKYRIYNDEDYEEDENYFNYHLVQEIINGNYVVETTERTNNGNKVTVENILIKGTNKVLLPVWFDKFIGYGLGVYLVEKANKYGYFDERGQQVGEWYSSYGIIDKDGYAVGANTQRGGYGADNGINQCDIISSREGKVIAKFKRILTNKAVNHKILVQDYDDLIKGYDLMKRNLCYQEFEKIIRITSYHDVFYCQLKDTNENVIFDFNNQRITAEHVVKIEYLNRINDIFKLTKSDGTFNAYSLDKAKELIPYNVNDVKWANGSLLYLLNGKYYVYSYIKNTILSNPNGIELHAEMTDYDFLVVGNENAYVTFYVGPNSMNEHYWSLKVSDQQKNTGRVIDKNTPPEIVNIYNHVTGQQQQVQQQEPQQQQEPAYSTVGEDFKRFMKRIDEADKLRKNEHYG